MKIRFSRKKFAEWLLPSAFEERRETLLRAGFALRSDQQTRGVNFYVDTPGKLIVVVGTRAYKARVCGTGGSAGACATYGVALYPVVGDERPLLVWGHPYATELDLPMIESERV